MTGFGQASQMGLAPRLLARSSVWRSRGDTNYDALVSTHRARDRPSSRPRVVQGGPQTLPISSASLALPRSRLPPPTVFPILFFNETHPLVYTGALSYLSCANYSPITTPRFLVVPTLTVDAHKPHFWCTCRNYSSTHAIFNTPPPPTLTVVPRC